MVDRDYFTIGELAKKMNITVRTLQYYDKEGLLNPSVRSEGGRRLYTKKDMVQLHQILSMKYLGFSLDEIKNNLISLDTPQEVMDILSKQKEIVKSQISNLTSALSAIEALQIEVAQMHKVDFNKYADIIALLRLKNEGYWIVKFFDDRLMTHIKDKFSDQPDQGQAIFNKWKRMCEETALLKIQGVAPQSDRGMSIAAEWWSMIMEFTGGDLSLLPELMKFEQRKQEWSKELQEQHSMADEFIGEALTIYLQQQGIYITEWEESL